MQKNNLMYRFFLVGFSMALLFIAILTPPFQSPDEIAHFQRAYTISNGDFFLLDKGNGLVDSNLIQFKNIYQIIPFHYDVKNSNALEIASGKLYWSNNLNNVELSNTAVYFPFPYIPQSVGITIGRLLDFSIYDSYRLSKFIAILSSLIIIYITTNKVYPISPLGYF